jgi:hypothetical protein
VSLKIIYYGGCIFANLARKLCYCGEYLVFCVITYNFAGFAVCCVKSIDNELFKAKLAFGIKVLISNLYENVGDGGVTGRGFNIAVLTYSGSSVELIAFILI